ncbi:MAG: hypothetical protein ABMB14_05400 [Myxococcota bacterium]
MWITVDQVEARQLLPVWDEHRAVFGQRTFEASRETLGLRAVRSELARAGDAAR